MSRITAYAALLGAAAAQTWVVYTPSVYMCGTGSSDVLLGTGTSDPQGATCVPVSNMPGLAYQSVLFTSCADSNVAFSLYSDAACQTALPSTATTPLSQYACTNVTVSPSIVSLYAVCNTAPGPSTHGTILGFAITLALLTAFLFGFWVWRDMTHKRKGAVEDFEGGVVPETGGYQSLNGSGH